MMRRERKPLILLSKYTKVPVQISTWDGPLVLEAATAEKSQKGQGKKLDIEEPSANLCPPA
jgi:hypothetical protein